MKTTLLNFATCRELNLVDLDSAKARAAFDQDFLQSWQILFGNLEEFADKQTLANVKAKVDNDCSLGSIFMSIHFGRKFYG
jgi:hypothetical protein